jgi:hypothetical protein
MRFVSVIWYARWINIVVSTKRILSAGGWFYGSRRGLFIHLKNGLHQIESQLESIPYLVLHSSILILRIPFDIISLIISQ